MKEESLEKSTSVRKLLIEGVRHWKEERALKFLENGKVSFLKAAEIAGLSIWDFSDLVRDKGIVWVKSGKFIRSDIKNSCH